jgi:hypothetical protein
MKETFEEYSRRVYGHEKFVSNLSDKQAIWDYQQSRIDELTKQLEEAKGVIEFYGNVDNWLDGTIEINDVEEDILLTNGLLHGGRSEEFLDDRGGKRARKYLNK